MNVLPTNLQPYAKAVAAFVALLIPFLTVFSTALADGRVDANEITNIFAATAALVGGVAVVFQVKNKPNLGL